MHMFFRVILSHLSHENLGNLHKNGSGLYFYSINSRFFDIYADYIVLLTFMAYLYKKF